MGQSGSKNNEFEIPELFYVHKEKSRVLHISQGIVSKLNFSKKLKIRKDSAIGCLNRRKILVCGGSDSAGCFTNDAILIDPIKLVSKIITPLPCPCANGFLFEYTRWVYFVGAVSEGDIEDDDPEVPAPLMRYSIRDHKWETFAEKPQTKSKTKFQDPEEAKTSKINSLIKVSDLKLPTVFFHMGKLYFVGGSMRGKKGKFRKNSKVFSMDLNEEPFTLKAEKFKLPKNLKNPVCVSRGSDVLITGGTEQKVKNLETWSLAFVNKSAEFTQEPEFVLRDSDSHPAVYTGVYTVVFNFPEIAFLKNKGKSWEKISIVQKTGKKPTPELNKTVVVEKSKIRERDKSAGNLRKEKKMVDDESEEEKINPFPKLEAKTKMKKTVYGYESDN